MIAKCLTRVDKKKFCINMIKNRELIKFCSIEQQIQNIADFVMLNSFKNLYETIYQITIVLELGHCS